MADVKKPPTPFAMPQLSRTALRGSMVDAYTHVQSVVVKLARE